VDGQAIREKEEQYILDGGGGLQKRGLLDSNRTVEEWGPSTAICQNYQMKSIVNITKFWEGKDSSLHNHVKQYYGLVFTLLTYYQLSLLSILPKCTTVPRPR